MSKQYDMESDKHYLQLLSQSFPTVADASTEIINLQAILNLPRGRSISLPIYTESMRLFSTC